MDAVERILAQWRQARPDLDVAPMGLIGRLNRIAVHLRREMEQTFARHGLNGPGFDVLATLRRSPPPHALSPGALMAAMMITSGTVTHRIDLLEKAGLVARRPNPEDGRGFLVTLTARGFAVIEAAVADHVRTQARLTAALPPAGAAELNRLLALWLAAFEEAGREEAPDGG